MTDTQPGWEGRRRTLWTLCAVPFIMVLGNSMLIPVLPQIRNALNISLFQAGLLITAFSGPAAAVILVAGYLADRYGRKTVLVPALVVYGVGGIMAGGAAVFLASPYPFILAARAIQGAGAGGTYQIAMVWVSDRYGGAERSRALGLLEAWNGMGKVISPTAGAGAALLAWFAPFFVYGVLALPVALAVLVGAHEAGVAGEEGRNYWARLRSALQGEGRSFGAALLAGFTVLFLLFGTLSYASDIMESHYDIGGFSRGLLISLPVAAMAATSYASGRLMQNCSVNLLRYVVSGGCLLLGGGLFAAIAVQTPTFSLAALCCIGIGTGLTLPALNTLVTSSAPPATRGFTTALYGTVRFIGVALGPPALGLLAPLGRPVVLAVSGALASSVAGLCAAVLQPHEMMSRRRRANSNAQQPTTAPRPDRHR